MSSTTRPCAHVRKDTQETPSPTASRNLRHVSKRWIVCSFIKHKLSLLFGVCTVVPMMHHRLDFCTE